jgi:hypothetical protein
MHAVLKCTLTSVGYAFCFVTFNDCAFTCSTPCVNTALNAVIIVTISTWTTINVVSMVFFGFIIVTYPITLSYMCAPAEPYWRGNCRSNYSARNFSIRVLTRSGWSILGKCPALGIIST